MLGQASMFAEECFKGNFIGADFDILIDLTNQLPDNWREFNQKFIPIWLQKNPTKSKISAGLSCGALWTISKGILKGDIVLCPNGQGSYFVGEVLDDYSYHKDQILPHRRTVQWYSEKIDRSDMSEELKRSSGSIGTVSNVTRYANEIEILIGGSKQPTIISTDATVEDASVFALEKHLEDFLVVNWIQTELGRDYDLFEENGVKAQQFPTDTGFIDVLAISKDKKTILVIELKKGRASDNVVGQIQRYMGYVKEELADATQTVRGVIIAFEDDLKIKRALSVTNNIEFFRYQVSFRLFKN